MANFSEKSCYFNGVDEYANLGNAYSFDYNFAFSISFWFKTTTTDTWRVILGKYGVGIPSGWDIQIDASGHIQLQLVYIWATNRIQVVSSGADLRDGLWHHVVIVWTGLTGGASDCSIYIDGVINSVTVSADTLGSNSIANNFDCYMAARVADQGTGHNFEGNLDEITIYKTRLIQREITNIYNAKLPNNIYSLSSARSLVGWWRMGDGDSAPTLTDNAIRSANPYPIIHDAAGVGPYHGTMISMVPADIRNDVPGRNKSCYFDGVNEYVDLGNTFNFDTTDTFSISFWWRKSLFTGFGPVISRMQISGPRGWLIWVSGYTIALELDNTNLVKIFTYTNTSITDGNWFDDEWYHCVITWNGNASPGGAGANFYVNGILRPKVVDTDTLGGNSITNSATAQIGACSQLGFYAAGNTDEVAFYNKELSAAEVTEIYNQGAPVDLTIFSSLANLIGWWKMGDGDIYPTLKDSSVIGYSPLTTSIDLNNDTQNESINFGNFPAVGFDVSEPFSAGAWFKWTGVGYHVLMSKKSGPGWWLYAMGGLDAGNIYVYFRDASFTSYRRWLAYPNDGQWHQILFTYDGSGTVNGITIWKDGASGLSATSSGPCTTLLNAGSLLVGARSDSSSEEFIGKVCHSFVYDKQLSAGEIAAIYNGGIPPDLSLVGPTGNLVHWSALGDGGAIGAGNVPDLSGGGNNGTFVNGESGDFVADVPFGGNPGIMTNMEITDIVGDAPSPFSKWGFGHVHGRSLSMGDVLNFEYNDSFTLSIWFKAESSTGSMIGKGEVATEIIYPIKGYTFWYTSSGELLFDLSHTYFTGVQVKTINTFDDGRWHHAVAVYNGNGLASGVTVYVDNVVQTLTTVRDNLASQSIITTWPFEIGACYNRYYRGVLDEAAVYDTALSAGDISDIYGDGKPNNLSLLSSYANLVGWWRMGDAAGDIYPTIVDCSANSNDGTIYYGSPQLIIKDTPGSYSDHSCYFDGSSKYITMGNVLSFSKTEACSFSCWIKATGRGQLFAKMTNTPGWIGYQIYVGPSEEINVVWSDGVTGVLSITTGNIGLFDGQWHHVCVTKTTNYNAAAFTIYVDGSSLSKTIYSDTLTGSIINSVDFQIGAQDVLGSEDFFSGYIDEAAVYNATLTPTEVTDIYNNGVPTDLGLLPTASNLVAWWRMGDGQQ